jgi:hypothetical protein
VSKVKGRLFPRPAASLRPFGGQHEDFHEQIPDPR